jgi:ABC-type phosphate/phosphonate transport system ATPase subunit
MERKAPTVMDIMQEIDKKDGTKLATRLHNIIFRYLYKRRGFTKCYIYMAFEEINTALFNFFYKRDFESQNFKSFERVGPKTIEFAEKVYEKLFNE